MLRKFFPAIGVLALVLAVSGLFAANAIQQANDHTRAEAGRDVIVRLSMIIGEVQRERALISTFGSTRIRASESEAFRDVSTVDAYRDMLVPDIQRHVSAGGPLFGHRVALSDIYPSLERLEGIRAAARSDDADPLETFIAYGEVISVLQAASDSLYEELDIPHSHQSIEPKLIYLAEYLERERGYGLMTITGVASQLELTRARQANLAALADLQSEIQAVHSDDQLTPLLVPFMVEMPQIDDQFRGVTLASNDPETVQAIHDWFGALSSQINHARLLHTRLLAGSEGESVS